MPVEQVSSKSLDPKDEVETVITTVSAKIKDLKARIPKLDKQLKENLAEEKKRPKPPGNYVLICGNGIAYELKSEIRQEKKELKDLQDTLSHLQKTRKTTEGRTR